MSYDPYYDPWDNTINPENLKLDILVEDISKLTDTYYINEAQSQWTIYNSTVVKINKRYRAINREAVHINAKNIHVKGMVT